MAINIGKNSDGDVTYQNPPVDRVLFPNITEYSTPEEIQAFVDAWLEAHPEATTTVQDGSILPVKLDSTNDATDGYVLSYNATAGKFEWYDVGGELDEINSDITDLKQDFNNKFPVSVSNSEYFENVNYGTPENVEYTTNWVDGNGLVHDTSGSSHSLIIDVEPNTTYYFRIPLRNRLSAAETSGNEFIVGQSYTPLSLTNDSENNYFNKAHFTTGNTANKVFLYFYSGTWDYDTYKENIYITKNTLLVGGAYLRQEYNYPASGTIAPLRTTFFEGKNYFDPQHDTLENGVFINPSNNVGAVKVADDTHSLVFSAEPNTTYYLYIPNANRAIVAEALGNTLSYNESLPILYNSGANYPIKFTTGATTKYVATYYHSGSYDVEANKNNIVLCKDIYTPVEYVNPKNISNIAKANILIFGDSITDCCTISVNSDKQTTAYAWKNPSNSYVNAGGVTVNYSMWAKILKENQPCGEIRNYARSGASYKTMTRDSGEERQNLQYQIDVALNDVNNPNHVFDVDSYTPDIVIFALGTNDGTPEDSFDTAMGATVASSDGTIDVNATLSALDDSKTIASARKAFMRIKQAFPLAQIYCVLPIQRADNDTNWGTLRTYLSQMAERYDAIIIDGTATSGITRDFNVWNGLGVYLKDGLHPNEKGQNLIAKMIISAINKTYVPFGTGYNT